MTFRAILIEIWIFIVIVVVMNQQATRISSRGRVPNQQLNDFIGDTPPEILATAVQPSRHIAEYRENFRQAGQSALRQQKKRHTGSARKNESAARAEKRAKSTHGKKRAANPPRERPTPSTQPTQASNESTPINPTKRARSAPGGRGGRRGSIPQPLQLSPSASPTQQSPQISPTPPTRDPSPHPSPPEEEGEQEEAVLQLALRPQDQTNFASYAQPRSIPLTKHKISDEEKKALSEKTIQAGNGIRPATLFEDDPSMKKSVENFVVEMHHDTKMATCVLCNERQITDSKKAAVVPYECKRCKKELKDFKKDFPRLDVATFVPSFGSANDMNPWWHPDPLAVAEFHDLRKNHPLSEIEKSMIAQYLPIMTVIRLKSQQSAFKGNVINFLQDIQPLCTVLPRLPSTVPTFIVRRKRGELPTDYKDFKVSRVRVYRWLRFLKKWNAAYARITIDERALDQHPDGGSAYDQLRELEEEVVDEVVNEGQEEEEEEEAKNDDDDDDELDGGVEEGPVLGDNDDNEQVLYTGIGRQHRQIGTALERLQAGVLPNDHQRNPGAAAAAVPPVVVPWPERADEPVDEYKTEYLLTRSFPTLFPFGTGDITNNIRVKDVSYHDGAQHYLWFAYRDDTTGIWEWPLAQDIRLVHYLQDVDERKRIQSQASIFLQQNPSEAEKTIDELREMVRSEGGAQYALNAKMQRYGANVLGSNAYMGERKKELLALINEEGIPTIWFTLSLANHYWDDLNKMFGEPPVIGDEETDEEFEKRWKKQAKANYTKHAHVVNEHFVRRVKSFVDAFFGEGGLEATWTWYRFEWQKRGNIHAHGLGKLKNDPGLTKLGLQVQEGRAAQLALEFNRAYKENKGDGLTTSYEDHVFQPMPEEDVWLHTHIEDLNKLFEEQGGDGFTAEQEQELLHKVETCYAAEIALVTFRDFLLTSNNPTNPTPADAGADHRDVVHEQPPFPHPCSRMHSNTPADYAIGGDNANEIYASLTTFVQRHRHNAGYCMKDGKCRFNFPRPLLQQTRCVIKQIAYKGGPTKGGLRRTLTELQFQTNDRWMNSHSPLGMVTWGANMDMSILIDAESVVSYVAKYCTKSETPSAALSVMIRTTLKVRIDRGQSVDTKKVIRSVFNKTVGQRDKSLMESCHLLNSTPVAVCSHSFATINIASKFRQVNNDAALEGEAGEEGDAEEREPARALVKNVVDMYGVRMTRDSWQSPEVFDPLDKEALERMSMAKFVRLYRKTQTSKITKRTDSKKMIFVFSPQISSDPDKKKTYFKYCWYALLRLKPWHVFYEDVIGVPEHTCRDLDAIDEATQKLIIETWRRWLEMKLREDPDGNDTDFFLREIDKMRSKETLRELEQDEHALQSPENRGFSVDDRQPDFFQELCDGLRNLRNQREEEDMMGDIEWEEQADHTVVTHDFGGELTLENVKAKWKEINDATPPPDRRIMHLADLSAAQQQPVIVWLKTMGLWTDEHGVFLPAQRRGNCEAPNAMIIAGAAGTGKSYIIDCLVTEALERSERKQPAPEGKPYFVLVMAPTGRAAMGAKGYTIQSREGLSVPVNDISNFEKCHLGENALLRLQTRMVQCVGVVVDESSMVHQTSFFWVHFRLTEAFQNDLPFGGIPIAWCGDAAQLPPVGGSSTYCFKTAQGKTIVGLAKKGYDLWRQIKNVFILKETRRQRGQFSEMLLRLRDGNSTQQDWEYLNLNCASQHKTQEEIDIFNSPDTTWLFNTNADNTLHNTQMLKKLGTPRVRIDAEHDSRASASKSVEFARRLSPSLCLSVGAKIMLLWNLNSNIGLVNGATGTVKDWLYKEGDKAPALPQVLVVEMNEYSGPPFFSGEGQEKWVPFVPQKHMWPAHNDGDDHYRTQFPISLAWGLTVWKAQGMTITTKLGYELGNTEPEAGLTYVALSRMTQIENLFIGAGCTLARLTTTIQKNKKLQVRLAEDRRLLEEANITLAYFFPTQ